MSEWWTYRPSDFLLFAPRTYYRLFELYNADIWPLHIVALLAGVMILVLMLSRAAAWRGRVIAAILAACWLWIAWAFTGSATQQSIGPPVISQRALRSRQCC